MCKGGERSTQPRAVRIGIQVVQGNPTVTMGTQKENQAGKIQILLEGQSRQPREQHTPKRRTESCKKFKNLLTRNKQWEREQLVRILSNGH